MTSKYTKEDFENARFAEHSDGRRVIKSWIEERRAIHAAATPGKWGRCD